MTVAVAKSLQGKPPDAEGVPGVLQPLEPAHVIKDDAEALTIATGLAKQFVEGASARDRDLERPLAELDAFSQSGLWSINVPKAFGGPELSYVTLAKVIAIISAADPSIGQIPQNHLGVVAAIRTVSDPRATEASCLGGFEGGRVSATPFPSSAANGPPTSKPNSRTRATT